MLTGTRCARCSLVAGAAATLVFRLLLLLPASAPHKDTRGSASALTADGLLHHRLIFSLFSQISLPFL